MGYLNRFRKTADVWNPLGHLLVDDLPPLAGAVFPHDDDDVIPLTDDLRPLFVSLRLCFLVPKFCFLTPTQKFRRRSQLTYSRRRHVHEWDSVGFSL
jgi:hypothetical protein